ncbi:mannose-1-phosphate guanylyltransferase/mannose-6-phosphate isomerase [Formicincola oecophyllae]|uniref:mannose-1-phosphate guanylyltransferase n=1 Tax=Formicincola oecophyllae TaxID=2558361 RepID=A0A4Y6UBC4_9PROT|nr:mannose-1-phosphate guanylyltransferase/mannose-6-phosphate isomerase [Formicincola oecophyllae]QDH13415.1 mannose-1-phosphate guanylyltransferase/mannose-6-phosphate isomerase [Formicincola oecophyllae]
MTAASSSASILPVILCGGSGTRLWPLSRKNAPKQFAPLLSKNSMFQETVLRVTGPKVLAPLVICNAEQRFIVAEQLRAIGIKPSAIMLEPEGRDSAPAIAAAAVWASKKAPDALLWVSPADALMETGPEWDRAFQAACEAAQAGAIATFGMKPTKAETGYGYIERGKPFENAQGDVIKGAFQVSRFTEKPDQTQAEAFLKSGRYDWNAGIFIAQAKTWIDEFQAHEPKVLKAAREALKDSQADLDFIRLDPKDFAKAPKISIDYAVAERTSKAVVVPASFTWSDVGSWSAVHEATPQDENGNAVRGDVVLHDAHDCYVRSEGMLTTVVGLEDVVVVTTRDAVLVTSRKRAQDIKPLVSKLQGLQRPEVINHKHVARPWGSYETIALGDRYQVKSIKVDPGKKLSLQKHHHRAEHWVVVSGTAIVTRGDERLQLTENESVYLPLGEVHRLENPGVIPLVLVEVQSGSYLGEDDIVRFEDDYARHK